MLAVALSACAAAPLAGASAVELLLSMRSAGAAGVALLAAVGLGYDFGLGTFFITALLVPVEFYFINAASD